MKPGIGIIIAMDKELRPFLDGKKVGKTVVGNKEFYTFKQNKASCVVVNSGIGKVNAAYAATVLIREFQPDFLITTGISGGLGRCELLELVAAKDVVQHDVDTTALGDEPGFVSTVEKVYFETDEYLTDLFVRVTGAREVRFACGDQFVADNKRRDYIVDTFDASACDMESGAIAQVAFMTETPFVAVRCISDGGGDGARMSYDKMTDVASEKLAKAVTAWIDALSADA